MDNLKRDILSLGNHEFLVGGDLNMVTDANTITATNNFSLDIKKKILYTGRKTERSRRGTHSTTEL